MKARTIRVVCASVGGWWTISGLLCAQTARILEETGQASEYALGQEVNRYVSAGTVSRVKDGVYSSKDGAIELKAERDGRVREVRVSRGGVFTQRLITINQSTMEDVLKRYGRAHIEGSGNHIVLRYVVGKGGEYELSFGFESYGLDSRDGLRQRVRSVTLRQVR